MTSNHCNPDYQRAVSEMAHREVYYCVSSLVEYLAKDCDAEFYDDILSVCISDDYESAAEENGWHENEGDIWTRAAFEDEEEPPFCDDAREACDIDNIEPHQIEAYEHWIVSNWLAGKLEERGEMVARDILGLTIWGRPTTGQAISIDHVICEIYDSTRTSKLTGLQC